MHCKISKQESGVGRWQTIRLATLSFYEYLQLKKLQVPSLAPVGTLREMFDWSPTDFARVSVFLYLCLRDGGLLDMQSLCSALEAKRPTVSSYIDLLEATHLIHRLRPFLPGGSGADVLYGGSGEDILVGSYVP